MNKYKIISEQIFQSPNNKRHTLVDVTVALPNNKQVVWQYIKVKPVVSIAAITSDQKIYVVRQWRPARKDFVYELPAGAVEDINPTPEQVIQNANRELQEEIGVKAGNIQILNKFSPTIHMDTIYYATLATDLTPSSLKPDEDEEIKILCLNFNQAWKILIEDQLPSAITLINMLEAKKFLNL